MKVLVLLRYSLLKRYAIWKVLEVFTLHSSSCCSAKTKITQTADMDQMLLFTTREDSDKFLCDGRETGSVEHLAEGIELRIKTRNTEESEGTCAVPAKQSKAKQSNRLPEGSLSR